MKGYNEGYNLFSIKPTRTLINPPPLHIMLKNALRFSIDFEYFKSERCDWCQKLIIFWLLGVISFPQNLENYILLSTLIIKSNRIESNRNETKWNESIRRPGKNKCRTFFLNYLPIFLEYSLCAEGIKVLSVKDQSIHIEENAFYALKPRHFPLETRRYIMMTLWL